MPLTVSLASPQHSRPAAWPRTSILAALVAICLLSLAFTTSVRADTSGAEKITFQENLAGENETLASQYQVSDGVEFDNVTPGGDTLGFPGSLPMQQCDASLLTNGYTAPGASPIVVLASRSAGDNGCRSSSEFFGPIQGFLFHVDDARASLSFQMRAFPEMANQLSSITGARAIAYRSDGAVLDEVQLSANEATSWSTVALSTADPAGIQYVAVIGEIGIGAAVGVQMDNLELPEALTTVQPDFRITESGLGDTGDLVEGDTLDVPVQIVRENGSSGTVTVTAQAGEGPALSSVAVNQAPAGEPPGTAVVELTAAAGQAGKQVTVIVNGSGDVGSGNEQGPPVTLTFTVAQDLALSLPTSASAGQDCQVPLGAHLVVNGATPMNVEVASSDGFSETVAVSGRGEYAISPAVSATYAAGASTHTISFRADELRALHLPPTFSQANASITLQKPTPEITLTSGDEYTTPEQASLFAGVPSQILFTASGLPCHQLALSVGEDNAPTSSFVPTGQGSASVTMTVPPAASAATSSASGVPLSIVDTSAGGATVASLPSIYLADFRADYAPHFLNMVLNGLQWSDFERTFVSGVDDCLLGVCWRDPLAQSLFESLQGKEPNGLCFGYTMLASEFYRQEAKPTEFGASSVGTLAEPTSGTTKVGGIPNYPVANEGSTLGETLISGWLTQFDATYQTSENDGVGGYTSVPQFAAALSNALSREKLALVNIRGGSKAKEGHSVLAYGIEQTGAGTYTIDVYNPNVGYGDQDALGEPASQYSWHDEATNLEDHKTGLANSQILLNSSAAGPAWTLTGAPNWTGEIENIGLTTMAQRPLQPKLPSQYPSALGGAATVQLTGAATPGSTGAAEPAAAISQITTAGHPPARHIRRAAQGQQDPP